MTNRLIPLTVAIFALALNVASAQLVSDMTPERIKEAIALGHNSKEAGRFLSSYVLQKRSGWGNGPRVGSFTTPYSRVVLAARAAQRKYKTLTAADVTPEMIAPEIHVYAMSQVENDSQKRPQIISVEAIVLMPENGKDRSQAVQPTKTQDATDEYKNLFGAAFEGKSMSAVFPMDAFREGMDLRVIYDGRVSGSSAVSGCQDCGVPIKLDKIR